MGNSIVMVGSRDPACVFRDDDDELLLTWFGLRSDACDVGI